MRSQSVQIPASAQKLKSPESPLLKNPYIRLKIVEARDVYLNQGTRRETGDLYARVTYEGEVSKKTNVITKTSAPRWNMMWDFGYYSEEGQEGNAISISIYDADPLGTDELIATQFILLPYFKQKNMVGKPLDLWLRMNPVNNVDTGEQIFVETDANLYQNLNLPEFGEEIITDKDIINDDKVMKLHIILEIHDPITIKHIHVAIPEVEEFKEKGLLECKVFIFIIKVTRNDGLEWFVKKRYSEIRALRQALLEQTNEVKEIPFPAKTLLKFTSKIFGLEKDYQKLCAERKKALEEFLSKIVQTDQNYQSRDFVRFFTSN